jgi:hypothetical protein
MVNDGLKMHVIGLKHKHHNLELELNELIKSHGDELEIQRLKKQKLTLKDQIATFEAQIG